MCRNTPRHELAMVHWLIFNKHSFRIYRHWSSVLINQYINLNNVALRINLTVTKLLKNVILKTMRTKIK